MDFQCPTYTHYQFHENPPEANLPAGKLLLRILLGLFTARITANSYVPGLDNIMFSRLADFITSNMIVLDK